MFADKNIQKSCSLNIRAQVWCIFFFFMYYSSRTSCARYILTFLGLTSCTSEHKESKRAEALFPGDPCPVSKPPTRSCIFIASPNYHSPLAPRFQVLQEGQRRRVDPNSSRLGPVWGGVHLWGETQRVTSSWIYKNIRKTMQHTASYSKLWMRFLNEDSFLPKKPFWLFHTRGFCICRLFFFSPSLCFFFFLAGLEWAVLSSLSKTKKNQDLATFEPESGDCCWAVRLFCLWNLIKSHPRSPDETDLMIFLEC